MGLLSAAIKFGVQVGKEAVTATVAGAGVMAGMAAVAHFVPPLADPELAKGKKKKSDKKKSGKKIERKVYYAQKNKPRRLRHKSDIQLVETVTHLPVKEEAEAAS